jgi:hypothetical protein
MSITNSTTAAHLLLGSSTDAPRGTCLVDANVRFGKSSWWIPKALD